MNRFRILLAVISLAGLVSAGPKISVDSANFDLGGIKEGSKKKVSHQFAIKNTGDEVLKITKVRPG